jgi:excinuclease ABC subunit B
MYADRITDSMKKALEEMNRRRTVQLAYNKKHGITPLSIIKSIEEVMLATSVADSKQEVVRDELAAYKVSGLSNEEIMAQLEKAMFEAAASMDFERAAVIRDQIKTLKGDEAPGKPKRTGGIKAPASFGAGKPDFGVKNVRSSKRKPKT